MVRVVRPGVLRPNRDEDTKVNRGHKGQNVIAVIAAVVCGVGVARAEVIDRVLAVVGGQLITLTDVIAARDLRLVAPPTGADPTRDLLSKLIDRELVLAEVERYAPPEPTAETQRCATGQSKNGGRGGIGR